MLTVEVLAQGKAFDVESANWDALHRTSHWASPFQSRTWIETWCQVYAATSRLRTIVVREGSDLVGVFPLVVTPGPWRAIRPAGVGPSDYLAPLVHESRSDVLQAISEVVQDIGRKQLIDLHQQPSDHPVLDVWPKEGRIEQAKCLLLDLPADFNTYVAGLSKSLRYDVRRLNGKALREKNAVIEWADPTNIDTFADRFFELHRLRWKSRGLPGAFFGRGESFQREWMRKAIGLGMLTMNSLVADGKTVGSVYAMRSGTTCYFYQAGMDPLASSLSPGTILVSRMIERAIEEGCTVFDFMRGDEPYKRRWKPTRERTNYRILLPPQNVVGKVGVWWNTTAWRVELKVRDRLEGKSLKPDRNPSSRS